MDRLSLDHPVVWPLLLHRAVGVWQPSRTYEWYLYLKWFFGFDWPALVAGSLAGLAAIYIGAWLIAGFKR